MGGLLGNPLGQESRIIQSSERTNLSDFIALDLHVGIYTCKGDNIGIRDDGVMEILPSWAPSSMGNNGKIYMFYGLQGNIYFATNVMTEWVKIYSSQV